MSEVTPVVVEMELAARLLDGVLAVAVAFFFGFALCLDPASFLLAMLDFAIPPCLTPFLGP